MESPSTHLHEIPGQGDPPAASTALVTIVGAILLLAVIMVAIGLSLSRQRYEDWRKLYSAKFQALAETQAGQMAQINSYRLLNAKEGVVAVPIDQAIEIYVREAKESPARIIERVRVASQQPASQTQPAATNESPP